MNATLFNQLLPADCGIRIGQVSIRDEDIVVELECTTAAASCPKCHQASSSLHGRYIRRLQDRPCLGKPLQWCIKARKFVCRDDHCPQKVFCERLPELADSHARTTTELTEIHHSIGMALGGEAGARLSKSLSMTTSPDTILRRVLDTSDEPGPPPRYVGIDDWAIRKGQSYGTILIDLERRCVIDILPGRDGEALKVWLKENPQAKSSHGIVGRPTAKPRKNRRRRPSKLRIDFTCSGMSAKRSRNCSPAMAWRLKTQQGRGRCPHTCPESSRTTK